MDTRQYTPTEEYQSAIKGTNYYSSQPQGQIANASHSIKELGLKRLHIVRFHLRNILENAKL